jgi:ferrous iron transport protein A
MDACRAWHEVPLASEQQSGVVRSLALLHKGARGVVSAIAEGAAGSRDSAGAAIGDVAASTILRRLMELGFVPGESIEVIEEVRPGGDPIAVRIGSSMFALRRREAAAIMVRLEQPHDAQLP